LAEFSSDLVRSLRVLFLLPVRGGGGGAHSIVQEATAMRAMGVTAQVIVRAVDLKAYQESYPEIPDVNGLFIGFADEAEVLSLSRNFDVVVATHYRSMAILRRIVDAAPWILPAYYTQDYEPLFEPEGTKHYCEAWHSYTAIPNMLLFAKTDWIRNQI